MSKLIQSFIYTFTKGHERTIKAKKNILSSAAIKILNIATSLALVPITINYVNATRYGIWLTLSSIVGWFSFFDIGFGSGLRNKFGISIAKGEQENARIYVSTTYAILGIIILVVLVIFFCINTFLDWSKILNAPSGMANELSLLSLIVFVFFCLQFELKLLTTVITANQQPAKASMINLAGSIVTLGLIIILTKITSGNLIYLGIAFSAAPVFVLIISSFWFFHRDYKMYSPSFRYVKLKFARDLMSIGTSFFFLQISGIILYETSNIIISQLFGPYEVTPYNISFKYFSIITMVMSTVMIPFWSAYTEAWTKNDLSWIKNSLKKLRLFWVLISIVTLFMLLFSNFFYKLWVGDKIKVSASISITMAAYVIINTWNSIYSMFLNGAGKIKLQLYGSILSMILNIPLAIYLGKVMGIAGIILSTSFLCCINTILEPIQTKKLLSSSAKGIWNQ